LNKKVRRKSRLIAISDKFKSKKIIVLDNLEFKQPKTKEAQAILDNLKLSGNKILLVLDDAEGGAGKSFRNIPGLKIVSVRGINTYDVLVADYLMFTKKSLEDFIKGLENEGS
jgi:large subunit ribosomal protein L4